MNIDAAFRKMSEAEAWDFVARDEAGKWNMSGAHCKLRRLHVLERLKAWLIRELKRVIFELDCQPMISALKGRNYDAADLGVLYREARRLCHASFVFYDFYVLP